MKMRTSEGCFRQNLIIWGSSGKTATTNDSVRLEHIYIIYADNHMSTHLHISISMNGTTQMLLEG